MKHVTEMRVSSTQGSCRSPVPRYATRHLVLAAIMRQCQLSTAFRSLTCQSRKSVPTRWRRSLLTATQIVRKRTLLALGATHVGGSPPTSDQVRRLKPDATCHPARWAALDAKRISRDPPRLPCGQSACRHPMMGGSLRLVMAVCARDFVRPLSMLSRCPKATTPKGHSAPHPHHHSSQDPSQTS